MPLDPLGTITGGGLRWWGQLGVISPFCSGQETLQVRVEGRQALQVLLCSGPVRQVTQSTLTPSQWMRLPNGGVLSGLLSGDGSWKVTCHLILDGLGDLANMTGFPW